MTSDQSVEGIQNQKFSDCKLNEKRSLKYIGFLCLLVWVTSLKINH